MTQQTTNKPVEDKPTGAIPFPADKQDEKQKPGSADTKEETAPKVDK